MFDDSPVAFWIKFGILVVPLSIVMFMFAPTLKWKLLFGLIAVPLGVYLALIGKSIKGVTPLGRKW